MILLQDLTVYIVWKNKLFAHHFSEVYQCIHTALETYSSIFKHY